jgi:uncharacterized protein DUF5063
MSEMERDEQVVAFAERARHYCAFIESAAAASAAVRLRSARALLAGLVEAACRLPDGDADAPEVEGDLPSPSSWPGFGDLDIYWEIFDPYEQEAAVAGSLSDDLLDVDRDLRRGLAAYDAGQIGAAVWDWKFHFDVHWGDHAVDALRALHRACRRLAGE